MKLTEKTIQRSLFSFYDALNHKLIVPNIYLHYSEADLITVQTSGYVNEIEIKISRADFKRDFKKKKHMYMAEAMKDSPRFKRLHTPNYFWFAIPAALLPTAVSEFVPQYYGIILMDEEGSCEIYKRAKIMHRKKVTDKQVRQIARSLMFKYWKSLLSEGLGS